MASTKDVPPMERFERPVNENVASIRVIQRNEHGDVILGHQTRPTKGTHLGVPTISWVVCERGASGLRTYYTWWLGDAVGQPRVWPKGSVTAYTVTGNRDRGTLKEVADSHIVKLDGIPELS